MERMNFTSPIDCWFIDSQLFGRLRAKGYCSVMTAACSALVVTCLFLIFISVLNFCVWMLDGIDVMIFFGLPVRVVPGFISVVVLFVLSEDRFFIFSFGLSIGCVHGPHSSECDLCTYPWGVYSSLYCFSYP